MKITSYGEKSFFSFELLFVGTANVYVFSTVQDPGILAIARGCPKLEKLMLTGCGAITGKSVRALARGCKALEKLSLSGCGGVGNDNLKDLAKGCTRLRHLNIAHCAQVKKSEGSLQARRTIILSGLHAASRDWHCGRFDTIQ